MTESTAKAQPGGQRPKIQNPEFIRQLKSRGIIAESLVQELLEELNGNALDLLMTLIQTGYGSKRKLCQIWCDSIGIAHVDLEKTLFQSDAVRKLPEDLARQYYAIPIYQMGDTLTVATATPQNRDVLKAIENRVGEPVNLVFALPQDIEWAIDHQFLAQGALFEFLEKIAARRALTEKTPITNDHLDQTAGSDAANQLHVALILTAIRDNASQINIEPRGLDAMVSFVNGRRTKKQYVLDKPVYEAVLKNLTKLAKLEEKQEQKARFGRILFPTPGKKYDIRLYGLSADEGLCIYLTLMGENPLDRVQPLTELYMARTLQQFIRKQLAAQKGLLLLAGPETAETTAIAYAMLEEAGKKPGQCVTIEDSPRSLLKGIQQYQVNPEAGMTGRTLLESGLNLKPQLIYIQNIDNVDLAKRLIQSDFPETFIIAGIEAEDTFHALSRSLELKLQHLLTGIIARQPAARLCDHCKQEYPLPKEIRAQLFVQGEATPVTAWREVGCPFCGRSGFSGTIGVYEFMQMTPELRQLSETSATRYDLHQTARQHNYENLAYDGIKKVLRGLTPVKALERIQSRLPE